MLDIKFIRENPDKVREACKNKGVNVNVDLFLELDKKLRDLQMQIDSLRAEKNKLGKEDQEKGRELKEKLKGLEEDFGKKELERGEIHVKIPNIPLDDVPVGLSEAENKIVKTVGKKPSFDFTPKNHWELAGNLDIIDKERAAKVTGSRFAYIK